MAPRICQRRESCRRLQNSEDENDHCIDEPDDSQSEQENEGEQVTSNFTTLQMNSLSHLSESSDDDVPFDHIYDLINRSHFSNGRLQLLEPVFRPRRPIFGLVIVDQKNEAVICKTSQACFELFINKTII